MDDILTQQRLSHPRAGQDRFSTDPALFSFLGDIGPE